MGHRNIPTAPKAEASQEVLMKQYELLISTYLKYLEITLKFVIFTYAVTGAILSYYLTHPVDGIMRYALVFPALMNGAFAASCFVAARWTNPLHDEMNRVCGLLLLEAYPDSAFLRYVLTIFGWLFVILTLGLITITIARLF